MYAFKFLAILSIAGFVSAATLAKEPKEPKEPKESKCDPVGCGLSIAKGTVSTVSACNSAATLAKKKKPTASDKAELAADVTECVLESVSLGLDVSKDCKDCASSG